MPSTNLTSLLVHPPAELGNPIPSEPMLFLKPVSSYVEEGGSIEIIRHFTCI